MTEDIFDMSKVKKKRKLRGKKWGKFIVCYVFRQLSSVKRLAKGTSAIPNSCSDASTGYRIAGISRKLESDETQFTKNKSNKMS